MRTGASPSCLRSISQSLPSILIPSVSPIARRMRPPSVGRLENAFHPATNKATMIKITCKQFAVEIFRKVVENRTVRPARNTSRLRPASGPISRPLAFICRTSSTHPSDERRNLTECDPDHSGLPENVPTHPRRPLALGPVLWNAARKLQTASREEWHDYASFSVAIGRGRRRIFRPRLPARAGRKRAGRHRHGNQDRADHALQRPRICLWGNRPHRGGLLQDDQ